MHIVQIIPELNEGGVERGTVECNREFVRRGHKSSVISRGGRLVPQIEANGGVHITHDVCSKNVLTANARMRQLRRLLNDIKPDIVHVRSRVPAWLVWFANRKSSLPVVSTVHGFNTPNYYSRIMTQADMVICVSNAIKDYVQQHYQTPDEKLRVIHRGLDEESFNPGETDNKYLDELRQKWELQARFVVANVGRITEIKDYETFIRAIALVRRDIPILLGLIVGGVHESKKNYFEELKKLVCSLDLEKHILFTGSESHIAEVYAASDVLVSSSRKPESFGRSLIEALAMERPVIAPAHGGALEIVKPGENGFLFRPGDAAGLAEALRAVHARKFEGLRDDVLERFSLAKMVDATIEIYQEVLRAKQA